MSLSATLREMVMTGCKIVDGVLIGHGHSVGFWQQKFVCLDRRETSLNDISIYSSQIETNYSISPRSWLCALLY